MSALFRTARSTDFDRLYRRHAASVYRYAYAVLGNHADAEDVTQQTFMNAYRAIARGTRPRKAENWLLTIAHNEVRRHFRSAKAKVHEVEFDENLEQPAPERSEPSLADVLRALQHLPPAQRSALVMREFEGRSYAEIARIMNVTQSALETQVFRARRALAEHLEGGLTCGEAEHAISRRLDGRLPRRVSRRLKAHLSECPTCVRFAELQKRQRTVLKGLSVMPIPASLFLFRGEQAAASVGLGTGAATAGSAAVGGGSAAVGTGVGGVAAGVTAKAAAVTAAAAVAGGVGYTVTNGPATVTTPPSHAPKARAVAEPVRAHRPIARVRPSESRRLPATRRKAAKAKSPRSKPRLDATKGEKKTSLASVKVVGPPTKVQPHVKARPTARRPQHTTAARKPQHALRPPNRKSHKKGSHAKAPPVRPAHAKALPVRPAHAEPKPPRDRGAPPQANGPDPAQKKP